MLRMIIDTTHGDAEYNLQMAGMLVLTPLNAVKCYFEIAKVGLYYPLHASLSLSEVTHPHLTLSVNNPLPCVINTA